ncbi:DUF535 domain-containing protein [Tabrizicola piscis]|uniref:DUF535 domain-containing protein n=1 Tax=Tabrizicola piscis TaxID=2494374 RepID=A0A3S8UA90_9RHOB|nr:DUF535 family protein [Tabrizicola piscis]AZL60500.1 DUF535 domain-containing protein [Tabrizicola piscis]
MTMANLGKLSTLARRYFPGMSPGALSLQARFVLNGLREAPVVTQMMEPATGTSLAQIMSERPQIWGALVWPYQCASWGPGQRLQRIVGHYDAIDTLPEVLRFSIEDRLVLSDLDHLHPGMKLVLDQPEWFLREGGLTLNLFLDSFRAYSVAFSLYRTDTGALVATIGGLQGRNRDDMLDTYRELTRILHGLRPRDFLIEALRILCRVLQVDTLLAVSEAARHHRHPYFRGASPPGQDYDAIWQDRGGVPQDPQFFALPINSPRRDMAEVKPNKRPMYRRRFDFLDGLEADIARDLPSLRPVRFADS